MLVIGLAAVAMFASTNLTITVWPEGREQGNARTWTLRCEPVGGTLPKRAQACRQLERVPTPFAPVPADAVCTELWGGPQEALVRGIRHGRRVWARFDRTNGCAISRWDRVRLLFPVRVGP